MENVKFRVLKANIVVRMHPVHDRSASGSILYPGGAMEHILRTGTVIDHGPDCHELSVGDNVVFIRFVAEVHTKKMLRDKLGQDILVCDAKDILIVCDDEDLERFR